MEATSPPPEGDVNLGPGLNAAVAVTLALVIVVTVMRVYVRVYVVKIFGWDDITIVLACLGTTIGAGLDFTEVHYGFGRPEYYLSHYQLQEYKKYTYGEWIQTFATLMFTKVSICLFLMRLPVSKRMIRPLQASVVALIVSNIVLTVLWIVQCIPIEAAWDDTKPGKCFSRGQLLRIIFSQSVISAVSDFAFAGFPILLLWKLQMKLRTKFALCLLMGLGVITGACCLVRTVLNCPSDPLPLVSPGNVPPLSMHTLDCPITPRGKERG